MFYITSPEKLKIDPGRALQTGIQPRTEVQSKTLVPKCWLVIKRGNLAVPGKDVRIENI